MVIFDSRDQLYKNPFGAVKAQSSVHFKIILERSMKARYSNLKIYNDDTGNIQSIGMFWCGMKGGSHEMWECDYSPSSPGIYWYNFEVISDNSGFIIGKEDGAGKALIGSNRKWQLTSYHKDFDTPEFIHRGIIYQIFPDRFYRSGKKKTGVPNDRIIHESWEDTPNFTPNQEGKYLNNDFFAGDIEGIIQKIPYLKSLGVTCLYLNPIFESHSNHRYDTANYQKIDPLLGSIEDFKRLCKTLHENGIRIILDGVFSHTGDDSLYFNKYSRYSSLGAYNSKKSPFFKWYKFDNWPDSYKSWWGINTLPETNEVSESFNNFINGQNGIIKKWIKAGADGWRLDVADELPDDFLYNLRKAAKEEKPDSLIIGEVWEDASNKISYGNRRKFLLGRQLDSVMNYPFKDAILDFTSGSPAEDFAERILSVLENYPPPAIKALMNPLSTHDTIRAITRLAGAPYNGENRNWQANHPLIGSEYDRGIALMKIASALQFTLPGVPSIYYGDEAGLDGYLDPFNRKTFPWGKENIELINWYKSLANIRKNNKKALSGEFKIIYAQKNTISYIWQNQSDFLLCAFNPGQNDTALNLKILNKPLKIRVSAQNCRFINKLTN